MGIFKKIMDNFNHGGVKVAFNAPSSINKLGTVLPIDITLTNKSKLRNVTQVSAKLQMVTTRSTSGFSTGNNSNPTTQTEEDYITLAEAKIEQPFSLAPNSTQNLHIDIPLHLSNGDDLGGIGNTISKIANFGNVTHVVNVSANVEGIALDPSSQITISIIS